MGLYRFWLRVEESEPEVYVRDSLLRGVTLY